MKPELEEFLRSLWHLSGYFEKGIIPDVGTRAMGGDTPLHYAVKYRNSTAVRLLLEAGADPNALGEDDYTPLHWAATKGEKEVVELLLASGALPSVRNLYGNTAAEIAKLSNHWGVVAILHGVESRDL